LGSLLICCCLLHARELADQRKVLLHVRGQYQVDHELADLQAGRSAGAHVAATHTSL
jgi:hypothetical protein